MATFWWDVVDAGTTLAAAFGGAWAAFGYTRRGEAERSRAQQIEQCNKAMLVLMRQYNWLLNYRRQFLDPLRGDKGRHLSMPPSDHLDFRHWTVDVPSLAFLIQTAATEMPFMLGLVEEKFHGVTALINARSTEHREFQLALAASPLDKNSPQPLSALHDAIGQRLSVTLQRATDQLYELVDDAISSLEAAGKHANVFRVLYPGATIIGFAPPLSQGQGAT